MSPGLSEVFPDLFRLRWCIARLGENDAMGWWDSHALTPQGRFALGRIFQRTTDLSAADLSFRAARARHDEQVPDEDLVHLFRLGEQVEGEFERWLMDRKAEGWEADVPETDGHDLGSLSVTEALELMDVPVHSEFQERTKRSVALGRDEVTPATPSRLIELSKRLAGAYGLSAAGELTVPYIRIHA